MDILDTMRTQAAVYWAPLADDDQGNPTFAAGREIRVRWEDVNEVVQGVSGETFVSKSKVYVGEDVARRGALWLGRLADVPAGSETEPFEAGGELIDKVDKIPTLDGTEYLRIAWL